MSQRARSVSGIFRPLGLVPAPDGQLMLVARATPQMEACDFISASGDLRLLSSRMEKLPGPSERVCTLTRLSIARPVAVRGRLGAALGLGARRK
jgi:hypothetical protein